MGWLNKQNKKEEIPSLPELPELPGLNEFSESENFEEEKEFHKLPSFPSSSLGNKFSQDAIKEAVSGGEEGDEEVFDADEFAPNMQGMQMMPQKPFSMPLEKRGFQKRSYPEEYSPREFQTGDIPSSFSEASRIVRKAEPIFVRLDKFEESLELFDKIKKKISEMDKMLEEIRIIKENEEKEIISWEKEIQTIKQQIKKIDDDIFSKIE
jgi:hypothetical protein